MIYIHDLFWLLSLIFAMIGIFRGAAKEMLVSISVVLAIFLTTLIEDTGFIGDRLAAIRDGSFLFYFRLFILFLLVLFGYQSPSKGRLPLKQQISSSPTVEKLLGFFIGLLNGALVFGTIWWFMHQADYPIKIFKPPYMAGADVAMKADELIRMLPPSWLQGPTIYFAIAISLALVLVMFV